LHLAPPRRLTRFMRTPRPQTQERVTTDDQRDRQDGESAFCCRLTSLVAQLEWRLLPLFSLTKFVCYFFVSVLYIIRTNGLFTSAFRGLRSLPPSVCSYVFFATTTHILSSPSGQTGRSRSFSPTNGKTISSPDKSSAKMGRKKMLAISAIF